MELLIALVASVLFASVFKRAIKAFPVVFYVLAIIVVAFFLVSNFYQIAPSLARTLYPYVQRCLFAFGLFTLVMFIGVFPKDSRLRRYFMPIRGELSIIASILTIGHVVNYLNAYAGQYLSGFIGMPATMVISLSVSVLLMILLIALTLTSFNAVRKRMNTTSWKKLQMFAYPFFLLIYVHLVLILLPTVSAYDQKAFLSIAFYTLIVIVYLALRLYKMVSDNKARGGEA